MVEKSKKIVGHPYREFSLPRLVGRDIVGGPRKSDDVAATAPALGPAAGLAGRPIKDARDLIQIF